MVEPISLSIRDTRRQANCGYCHEQIASRSHICRACNTTLHVDCYRELGRCPTLGCIDNTNWKAEEQGSARAAENANDSIDDPNEVSFRIAPRRGITRGILGNIALAIHLTATAFVSLFTLWWGVVSLSLCVAAFAMGGLPFGLVTFVVLFASLAILVFICIKLAKSSGSIARDLGY